MRSRIIPALRNRWPAIQHGMLVGCILAVALLVLRASNPFAQLRLALSDIYFVAEDVSGTTVIVAMDDASQAEYGRAPVEWSRSLYADLVDELNRAGARVVAFDVLFADPTADDQVFADALSAARTSEARTRFVLAAAGLQLAGTDDRSDRQLLFSRMMEPVSSLAASADYLGIVNVYEDVDGAMRRQPSRFQTGEDTYLSFPLSTYLAYLRVPASAIPTLVTVDGDTLSLTPDRDLTIDEVGFWRPYFFDAPSTESRLVFPIVSFRDVIEGHVSPETFQDKIVLVGVINSTGMTDLYSVPSESNGQRMAGIEIYAHAIESLLQDKTVVEQKPWSETVVIVALSLLASVLYAQMRWYKMLLTMIVLVALWVLAAFVVFGLRSVIVSLFYPTLAVVLPAAVYLSVQINTEFQRRRRAESLLESVVEISRQHMDMARILPRIGADLRRMTHSDAVAIWMPDDETHKPRLGWSAQPASPALAECGPLVQRAQAQGEPVLEQDLIATPVRWQGRSLAVFVAASPHGTRKRVSAALDSLTEQIAPGLENARLYAETTRQRALLETLVEGSPAGIMVLDDDLRVKRANRAVENALGVDNNEVHDRTLSEVLTAAGIGDTARTNLLIGFEHREAFRYEIAHNQRAFAIDVAPLSDVGWVAILNDVSMMAELSALKTRMIRMASHDLKNPLQSVVTCSYLLMAPQSALSETNLKHVQTIRRSSETMRQIIEEILSLEQLQTGAHLVELLDFSSLIDEVIQQHRADMERRTQQFAATVAGDLPKIKGDRRQLSQAVTNLLGNAIKYTPEGGRILLRAYHHLKTNSIRLEIEDTGYGISEADQAQLFQEFFRAKTPGTEDIPGTGLGLSIVKTIIESHQGRVWVQSTVGVGSTFFVELPCT